MLTRHVNNKFNAKVIIYVSLQDFFWLGKQSLKSGFRSCTIYFCSGKRPSLEMQLAQKKICTWLNEAPGFAHG